MCSCRSIQNFRQQKMNFVDVQTFQSTETIYEFDFPHLPWLRLLLGPIFNCKNAIYAWISTVITLKWKSNHGDALKLQTGNRTIYFATIHLTLFYLETGYCCGRVRARVRVTVWVGWCWPIKIMIHIHVTRWHIVQVVVLVGASFCFDRGICGIHWWNFRYPQKWSTNFTWKPPNCSTCPNTSCPRPC